MESEKAQGRRWTIFEKTHKREAERAAAGQEKIPHQFIPPKWFSQSSQQDPPELPELCPGPACPLKNGGLGDQNVLRYASEAGGVSD